MCGPKITASWRRQLRQNQIHSSFWCCFLSLQLWFFDLCSDTSTGMIDIIHDIHAHIHTHPAIARGGWKESIPFYTLDRGIVVSLCDTSRTIEEHDKQTSGHLANRQQGKKSEEEKKTKEENRPNNIATRNGTTGQDKQRNKVKHMF